MSKNGIKHENDNNERALFTEVIDFLCLHFTEDNQFFWSDTQYINLDLIKPLFDFTMPLLNL